MKAKESTGKKPCLKQFLVDIATSGKYTSQDEVGMSDYIIKYVLLNFISGVGSAILVGFIVVRLGQGKYGTVIACSVMLLTAIMTIVSSRMKNVKQIVPALMLTTIYGLLCIAVTYLGEAEGSNFLFIYMYPLLAVFLLGMKLGIIFSTIALVVVILQMFVPEMSKFDYPATVPIHLIVTYFLVFSVLVVMEITRQTKDRRIEVQNHRMRELKERAEASDRAKSEFLATMSHEIRTPMNAIIGIAQIQLQREELSGEYEEALDKIFRAGKSLLGIINDILDLSKIETGKMELNLSEYDISSLINDTIQVNAMRIGSKEIDFSVDPNSALPSKLYGDELRLKQILNNLLSNAIKYTDKGHVKLSISHVNMGEDVVLQFTIEDTGQGLTPDDKANIFTEYQRFNAAANRTTEGTGLGLSIAKHLLELMDGKIEIESEYGKGSTFTVYVMQKRVPCEAIGEVVSEITQGGN
jgi:signal transduction histidine kinase